MMREGEESQEDSLKITSDEKFLESCICILIRHELDSWSSCDSALNKYLNSQLSKWAEKRNSCTSDENSIKNWKNELDFIWKDFDSRSWRNKSHSILRCISWDSIENNFSQSMMKKLVSRGSMKEKLEVWWKNAFVSWNGVRNLSFLTLESFHTSQVSMRWNSNKIFSTLKNLKQTFTLSLSSCSPKLKMRKWGLRGKKWGVI